MAESPELSLATDEEIFAELKRRSEAVVLVIVRPTKNKSENCDLRWLYYSGGMAKAIGLCVIAQRVLLDDSVSGNDEDDDG